jgi:hypothetical protein
MLAPILSAKMIDPDVNGFYLVREVPFRCFSTFKLPKKLDLSSRRFLVSS